MSNKLLEEVLSYLPAADSESVAVELSKMVCKLSPRRRRLRFNEEDVRALRAVVAALDSEELDRLIARLAAQAAALRG